MEKVAKLLFELASVERLNILTAISVKSLKHTEIVSRFDMTTSETSRHLERLVEAGILAKNHQGEYESTDCARLLNSIIPFFEFVTRNREYIKNHDLTVLPTGFLARLGDLAECTTATGFWNIIDDTMQRLRAMKKRCWVMTDEYWVEAAIVMIQKASEGVDVRVIIQKSINAQLRADHPELFSQLNYPRRILEKVGFILSVVDDRARLAFPGPDRKIDMSTRLRLEDAKSCKWAEELYLHFWNQAK